MIPGFPTNTLLIAGLVLAAVGTADGQGPAGGNAERGAAVFAAKGGCVSCHRVRDRGSRLGPDLTGIGNTRKPDELRKATLDPSPEVQLENRTYRVVTNDGSTISGKLLNQGTASIQMLDSNERLVSFQKSSLREYKFVETAPMPSYRNKLSSDEVEDVVAYLSQLKGISQ
jgi:putative heme-binding domain-containing protein